MTLIFGQEKKPIFVSLSPNIERDDLWLALRLLFWPWQWKRRMFRVTHSKHLLKGIGNQESATVNLENQVKEYLGVRHASAFNSGRSAFMAILKGLALPRGSEILLQGFTCNAAVNPIRWAGLKPVFVDIDEKTFNIDPNDLERKVKPESKMVVVQHTFGLPADIDKILGICQRHRLILIEDCAHSLGGAYLGQKLGTFGRAAFFSFGRDKIISSVYGGVAVTNDPALAEKIRDFQANLSSPSYFWVFQQLLHPLLTRTLVMPLYRLDGLGRICLGFLQKIRVLSKAVHKKEKKGGRPLYFPKEMPAALALLALHQLKKLERFNSHRQKIASFYDSEFKKAGGLSLPPRDFDRLYLCYSLLIDGKETDDILRKARRKKIFLDDGWRKAVVVPPDTDQQKMGYQPGSCPRAEKVAQKIINLPTHINISLKDSQRIATFFNKTL